MIYVRQNGSLRNEPLFFMSESYKVTKLHFEKQGIRNYSLCCNVVRIFSIRGTCHAFVSLAVGVCAPGKWVVWW